MMGTRDEPGVTPLVAHALFERANELLEESEDESHRIVLSASYLQIHKEVLQVRPSPVISCDLPSSPIISPCPHLPHRDDLYDPTLAFSTVQDLLAPDPNVALHVRRDPKAGPYVQGLSERPLASAAELGELLAHGNRNRAVASTLMNAESSRSHAIVMIRVEQVPTDPTNLKPISMTLITSS